MKIFRKEKLANGRRHIYFCGMKIASYKKHHIKQQVFKITQKVQTDIPEVLCYTYVNEPYFPFAILYPLFVFNSNKNVAVEIAVERWDLFIKKYEYLLKYYEKKYPDKVFFHASPIAPVAQPGTMRFITQPLWRGKYVYIGDVDIMITEKIAEPHIQNIKKYNLDFSNIKRKGINKLSGLHFIEYEKMYPLVMPQNIDIKHINDEDFLYIMMKNRGYKIPDENKCTFRPVLGMHFSYYSRPPLPNLTTFDKNVDVFPSWFDDRNNRASKDAMAYLKLRYNKNIVDFMSKIDPLHLELRKIIQYMDMSCWFFINQDKLKI